MPELFSDLGKDVTLFAMFVSLMGTEITLSFIAAICVFGSSLTFMKMRLLAIKMRLLSVKTILLVMRMRLFGMDMIVLPQI